MRDGYKFEFGALDEPDAPKAQALKPLEEAAEVYGAWQDCDDMRLSPIMTARREYRQNLIDECMDVVQAVVSLLDDEGFTQEDVDAAIERAYEAGRAEVAGANLVQNLRRQLTSIEATVGDAIDLLDESVGGADCDE